MKHLQADYLFTVILAAVFMLIAILAFIGIFYNAWHIITFLMCIVIAFKLNRVAFNKLTK